MSATPLRRIGWVVAIATAAVAVLTIADRADPLERGLKAGYFVDAASTATPSRTRMGRLPSTEDITEAWRGSVPRASAATWTGSIVIVLEDTYTFSTASDGRSAVYVDGALVLENVGGDPARDATSSVRLSRGIHPIFIQYTHGTGAAHLEWRWARAGDPLVPVPAWVVHPSTPSHTLLAISLSIRFLLIAAEWAWVATLIVAAGMLAGFPLRRVRQTLVAEQVWSGLRWVLVGSVLMNATAVWWGLPSTWAPDELAPVTVLGALAQHFSHGWFDRYPPGHYYVLIAAMSPALLLERLGRIDLTLGVWPVVLPALCRIVSLAAGAGALIAIALTGARAFGARSGVFAAGIFALAAPFIYYAKTSNLDVPYLFWFACSLVWYWHLVARGRMRDYVWFAVTATFAVCTKDQAYALYLLMPLAVAQALWREARARRDAGWRGLVDPRIGIAAVVAVVVFGACHNLLFNFGGFLDHVRYITGPGSEGYRTFPSTLAGRAALVLLTGHLIKISWGWPVTLLILAGVVIACREPRLRRPAIVLLLPVVSYYFTFVNVILYNFDRFVLPMCLVLALFGGLALDRLVVSWGRHARWRAVALAAAAAYSLLYSTTVDALMLADSRYTVEQWLRDRGDASAVVGTAGPAEVLPRLQAPVEVGSLDELRTTRPAYYILNADYARAVPLEREWGQLIASLQRGDSGYRLVLRVRRPGPWPWLPDPHPDLMGPRPAPPNDGRPVGPFEVAAKGIFSVLRDINPTIEVYQRQSDADRRR